MAYSDKLSDMIVLEKYSVCISLNLNHKRAKTQLKSGELPPN